jgi:hypothetical protein
MIGREQPKRATQTDLRGAIAIGLDECMTALEEGFHDLTDGQAWSRPLPDRHSVGTIVMHCLRNLDSYGLWAQVGQSLTEADERFDVWNRSPQELQSLQQRVPRVAEMVDQLYVLRTAIFEGLDNLTEDDLRKPRESCRWYADFPDRIRADAYMRTIMHTMAHTRQIWMLRGAMGLTDKDGWPVQHWA